MMETNGTDEQIRSLYRRLEPRVDAETFCRTLGTHMTPRTTRRTPRKLRRALVVACVVVVALAALGTGIYEAAAHLGRSQPVLVLTDQTSSTTTSTPAQAALLANPYPNPASANSAVPSVDIPSAWAQDLGNLILELYPGKNWKIYRAVEVAGTVATELWIGPPSPGIVSSPPSIPPVPLIRAQVTREESGRLPQEGNPFQYQEFSTDYGHGLLVPSYTHGNGGEGLFSWFIRPDKLMIQVAVVQGPLDTPPSELLLDQEGLEKLLTYIASIIEMSKVETSSTGLPAPTTVPSPVTEEVRGYLDKLQSVWEAAGIPVLSVTTSYPDVRIEDNVKGSTKSTDPLPYVTLEVPDSVFASADYMFMVENIMRQTMVAIREGVPLHYLGIFMVANDGTRKEYSVGEVYQLAQAASEQWGQPAKLSLEETTSRMRKIAEDAAKTAGVTLESCEVREDASGRVVRIVGSVPDRATVLAPVKWFSAPPEDACRELNTEGAKISGLEVKVDDLKGAPVLRRVVAFSVGLGSESRWVAPELEAVQNQ